MKMCLIFKCIVGERVAKSSISRDRDSRLLLTLKFQWQVYDSRCNRQQ